MSPAGASTMRPRARVGTPLTRLVPRRGAPSMAPAGASTWRLRALFGTPLTKSRLPGSATNGPSGCVHMAFPRPCRHTLKRLVPPGRSTHGPIGRVHTASLRQFRHTPHTFRAPQGAPPMAPSGAPTWRPRPHFGTPVARLVPPRELHLWPQRVRPHGAPAPMSHTAHVSCHPGTSTDGPSGCVRMASPRPCRHTHHMFRAPQGASSTARSLT